MEVVAMSRVFTRLWAVSPATCFFLGEGSRAAGDAGRTWKLWVCRRKRRRKRRRRKEWFAGRG